MAERARSPRMPPTQVVRRAFGVRSRLRQMADGMFPASALVAERMFAASEVKLLGVVCDLGVPNALDSQPASAKALATSLGLHADSLERVLRHLASRGWFKRSRGGIYRLNARSRLLREDDPDSLNAWVRFMAADWHWNMWNHMNEVVASGGSAARAATGKEYFDWVHDDQPEAGETFDAAMQSMSSLAGPLMAKAIDAPGPVSICDVGGGTGRTLAEVLRNRPEARGVLYDLPQVTERGGKVLEATAPGRWSAESGDFFLDVPADHDHYILQAVLHDWNDERAGQILANVRDAMPEHGRIHVMDQVLDPAMRDSLATAVDVLMLALADGGRERTQQEWESLFGKAGLAIDGQSQLPILTWLFTLSKA